MAREKPRCQYVGPDGEACGLSKSASPHVGYGPSKHDYQGERRSGFGAARPLSPRSERPNRVQRRQEGLQAVQEYRARVRHCEAPDYGIQTPCGKPGTPDAILEYSHKIGKGMGGGKDYATEGEGAMLCRTHHRELDTDRETFRAAGLSTRAPTNAVPRPGRPSS